MLICWKQLSGVLPRISVLYNSHIPEDSEYVLCDMW
jgi:hypothetical protein